MTALERLAKVGASVLAACYVVGLLVVNTYLYQFGFSDFTLLRPKAVFTGAWVLLLIVVVGLPTVATFSSINMSDRDNSRWFRGNHEAVKRMSAAVLGPILLLSIVHFAWGEYLGVGYMGRLLLSFMSAGVEYVYAVVLVGILKFAFDTAPRLNETKTRRLTSTAHMLFWLAAGTGMFAVFIIVFATDLYAGIPDQFGGGRPRMVRLLLSAEGASLARELGLETLLCTRQTERVEMVYASEPYIVIRGPNPLVATVQFNRDLIEGIHVPLDDQIDLYHQFELDAAIIACTKGADPFDELISIRDRYQKTYPLRTVERSLNTTYESWVKSHTSTLSQSSLAPR